MNSCPNPTRRIKTRRVSCARSIAYGNFPHYGKQAVHVTDDGQQLVGVLEDAGMHWPVIRFPDGRWARTDDTIRLVVEQ